MKAYMIMPGARLVEEVEYDGTPEGLLKLYPYLTVTVDEVNPNGDHLMYAQYPEFESGIMSGWQVYCKDCACHHTYKGIGIIVGLTADDALTSPAYEASAYRDVVEWLGAEVASMAPTHVMS